MEKEENLNKNKVRLLLMTVKIIPMVIAFFHFLNIILAYLGIDFVLITYLAGVSLLSLSFMYIASYAFRFCTWHRMFIHYSVLIDLINVYDVYVGIPLDNEKYFLLLLGITVVCMFLILYFRICEKH